MSEQGGGKVVGVMKLFIIVFAVGFSIFWVPGLVKDYKFKAESRANMKRWEEHGISPVTRGMGSRVDTIKKDTVNKCP